MNKIKVLWLGDLVTPTGFSRVNHSIISHLDTDEFEVIGLGVNYKGDPTDYAFKIYPCSTSNNPADLYGFYRVKELCDEHEPDIIFILNDAWIQQHYLSLIKEVYKDKTLPKIVTYTPVDAKDHDPDWYENFNLVDVPVAYTKFGYREIVKANPTLESKLRVIPHGLDKNIFYKFNQDKAENKMLLFPKTEALWDSFIFLSAGRNQPRKKLDVTMRAFKLFSEDKPENVKLYLHCGIIDADHIDVVKMAKRLEMDNRLIISGVVTGVQKVPDKKLNQIYNACDVGINTSVGEGWCLPSMEHAFTGSPQIVPNHSALTEIWQDLGLFVEPIVDVNLDGIMTTGSLVRDEDVAEQMERIYNNGSLYQKLSMQGIQRFSSKEYNWDTIATTWSNLFKEVL